MRIESGLAVAMALALAGCGGAQTPRPKMAAPVISRAIPHRQVAAPPGLEGVIGATREALVSQFGPVRLDVRETGAVRLQWEGKACILDAYLYPSDSGGKPVTTFVDARRGDGRDVDKAACVAALKAR